MLHLLSGRRRHLAFEARNRCRMARHAQLVGQHLDRHREIQRAEVRVGRNRQQCVAQIEVVVVQPGLLRPEDGRYRPRLTLLDHAQRAFARFHRRPADRSRPRAGADHVDTVGQRVGERVDNLGVVQNVGRTGRPRDRIRVRKLLRPDQRQVAQTHVLHGAGDCPDVPGMGGSDKDYSNRHLLRQITKSPVFYRPRAPGRQLPAHPVL